MTCYGEDELVRDRPVDTAQSSRGQSSKEDAKYRRRGLTVLLKHRIL